MTIIRVSEIKEVTKQIVSPKVEKNEENIIIPEYVILCKNCHHPIYRGSCNYYHEKTIDGKLFYRMTCEYKNCNCSSPRSY